MFEVTDQPKRMAMVTRLKTLAREFFAQNSQDISNYEGAIDMLRNRYYRNEIQKILLTESQQLRVAKAMRNKPGEAEIKIFQSLVERAMEVQGQLRDGYKGDRHLSDRLQEALDIPSIQEFKKDLPGKSSQNLINRVGNRIFDHPK